MHFTLNTVVLLVPLLATQVSAHAIFVGSAAAASSAVRGDVTRAGTCNAAAALKSPIAAGANGQFTVFAKNFNAGADGATAVKTATLDTTGKGTTFSGAVTIVKNGNANPTTTETDQLTLALPTGTTCTGTGGACLVALASNAGFGNCVAVTPARGMAGGGAAPAKGSTSAKASATKAGKITSAVVAAASSSSKGSKAAASKTTQSSKASKTSSASDVEASCPPPVTVTVTPGGNEAAATATKVTKLLSETLLTGAEATLTSLEPGVIETLAVDGTRRDVSEKIAKRRLGRLE